MKSKSALRKDCDRVNASLREEAVRLKLGTKGSLSRLEESRGDIQVFSYWAGMEFQEFVRRRVERTGSANAQGLIVDGARLLKISSETTKRYMRALRAAGGPFAGLGDVVTINGRYVATEEDEYWVEEDAPPRPSPSGRAQLGEGGRLEE